MLGKVRSGVMNDGSDENPLSVFCVSRRIRYSREKSPVVLTVIQTRATLVTTAG